MERLSEMSGSTYILDYGLTFVKHSQKGVDAMIFERIVKLCKEKNISIARLEKEAGLGNATVRGWVKSEPTAKNLKAVADVLGVTIDELLRE